MVETTITGDAELIRFFETLDKKVQKKLTVDAVKAGARIITRVTKANVPVGPGNKHHPAGLMKASIVVKAGRRSRNKVTYSTAFKNPNRLATVTKAGKRHFYPAVVEYGDATHRPQAPFRKAFDSSHEAALKMMKYTMANGIESHR